MISCGMDAYGKSVHPSRSHLHDGAGQSTERQMMRMQHAYRVDECLLVCGQPSATWAELGSPRDKTIAMSTTRKLLWLRHASADQARQLQAAVPSMDLEKASKSWWPRPSPGRTAATVITFDRLSRRNRIAQYTDSYFGGPCQRQSPQAHPVEVAESELDRRCHSGGWRPGLRSLGCACPSSISRRGGEGSGGSRGGGSLDGEATQAAHGADKSGGA